MLLSYAAAWHISVGQDYSKDKVKTNKLRDYLNKSHLTCQATVLTYCSADLFQTVLFKFLWSVKCLSFFAIAATPLFCQACWTCQRDVNAYREERLLFWLCQDLITCGSAMTGRNTEASIVCGKTIAPHSSSLQLWALSQWHSPCLSFFLSHFWLLNPLLWEGSDKKPELLPQHMLPCSQPCSTVGGRTRTVAPGWLFSPPVRVYVSSCFATPVPDTLQEQGDELWSPCTGLVHVMLTWELPQAGFALTQILWFLVRNTADRLCFTM